MKSDLSRRSLIKGIATTTALAPALLSEAAAPVKTQAKEKEPVDYVNLNMGGIGQCLTSAIPRVALPFGAMVIAPMTTPGITDRFTADKVFGFPTGSVTLMPMSGPPQTVPAQYASHFDHDLETATPYYYKALLEDYDIETEFTVSAHAAHYRLTFPAGTAAHVLFSGPMGGAINMAGSSSMSGQGGGRMGGGGGGRGSYFYAEFSKPVTSSQALTGLQAPGGRGGGGRPPAAGGANAGGTGIMAEFTPGPDRQIGIRIGISSFSLDQARQNLQNEIPGWDFDKARSQARNTWNESLSRISIKGGTEDQRTVFYTCMYRVLTCTSNQAEDDKYMGPGDHQPHPANGHGFYSGNGGVAMWGNVRSLEPTHLLLSPQQQMDQIRSYIILYEQTGRMMGFGRGLSGHHFIACALDAYQKGYRDYDVEKLYQGLKDLQTKETFISWRDVPQTSLDRCYLEKGFFPALKLGEKETVEGVHPTELRQAVGVTLESTYDDWAMSEWARVLNKKEDHEYFKRRALTYRNVWDDRGGFLRGSSPSDGGSGYSPRPEGVQNAVWSWRPGGRLFFTLAFKRVDRLPSK